MWDTASTADGIFAISFHLVYWFDALHSLNVNCLRVETETFLLIFFSGKGKTFIWFIVQKCHKCAQGQSSPVYLETTSGLQVVVFSLEAILCMFKRVFISTHLSLYVFSHPFTQVVAYSNHWMLCFFNSTICLEDYSLYIYIKSCFFF